MKAKVKATIVVIMNADVDTIDATVQDIDDILDVQEVLEYLD